MPYAAIGFSDFWRRWHISLSTWLRDYLYIPLGGNRGTELRTYVNLMLTMLLGGLWHGANWTLRGLGRVARALSRGRALDPRENRRRGRARGTVELALALALLTYFLVNLTWVFFRAHRFRRARRACWPACSDSRATRRAVLPTIYMIKRGGDRLGIVTVQWLMRKRDLEDVVARTPGG